MAGASVQADIQARRKSLGRTGSMRSMAVLTEEAQAQLLAEAEAAAAANPLPPFRPIAVRGGTPRAVWVRVAALDVDSSALSYVGGFNVHLHELEVHARPPAAPPSPRLPVR